MKVVTMRGKTLDMAGLIAKHAQSVAVGNASMNARGDLVNPRGQVVKPREQIAMEYHASNPRSVKSVGIKALTSEMFASPAEAVASAQAEARAQTEARAQAERPQGGPPGGMAGLAPGKRRKLLDPSEPPDGGL